MNNDSEILLFPDKKPSAINAPKVALPLLFSNPRAKKKKRIGQR